MRCPPHKQQCKYTATPPTQSCYFATKQKEKEFALQLSGWGCCLARRISVVPFFKGDEAALLSGGG